MSKNYLLTPGPTPLPDSVREALSRQIIHHRTPQFAAILKECNQSLKEIFRTKNDVFILASSGTGAMEAAVANLLSPNDKAICVEAGKFGERWAEICGVYSVQAVKVKVEWGYGVTAEKIEQVLKENKDAKVVFVTLCETSTAAGIDLAAVSSVVAKTDAVIVVDAISALGAVELATDDWKVDVVVAGSQKGLMLPPGLSFISMSNKAYALMEKAKCPRYYFDLAKAKQVVDKPDTPFTPAVSLIVALKEALDSIKKEGLDNLIKRFSRYAKATRKAAESIGLKVFARDCSDAVTAILLPDSIDGAKLVKTMRDNFSVSVAGGQGKLKGKIIRIAHMGYIQEKDILKALEVFEEVLSQMGYEFQKGKAVQTAKQELSGK